ncbi:hypothetical protein K3495_g3020 [Podosphaera aphanis]|nr:hypothetical protein K3495_g3020 [Podosphaera aphanis]
MSLIRSTESLGEDAKFKTKYGDITIFSYKTFPEWHEDYSLIWSLAGLEGIIDGTEECPTGPARATEKYEAKFKEVKIIINGSIGRTYKQTAKIFFTANDLKGLRAKLNELNPAQTPHFASPFHHDLHQVKFDPLTQTIQGVVDQLQKIQAQLEQAILPQSDKMIRQCLIQAFPNDDF